MNTIAAQDILFDDFALLEKHIGRQQLMATSVNTNCDCASSPIVSSKNDLSPVSNFDCIGYPLTSRYGDRNPDHIAPSLG